LGRVCSQSGASKRGMEISLTFFNFFIEIKI
jgi:hypothetical protein